MINSNICAILILIIYFGYSKITFALAIVISLF